jgi:REP element-mobilizing transposase RayT
VFKDPDEATAVLSHFQRTAREKFFKVLAYCVMPDHAHLLVKGLDEKSDLRQFAKTVKERSGRAYRKRSGQRLWQEGYFDRVLRDEGDARKYAQYIVTDPVRAGLVATPADYSFVGCTDWSFEELMTPSF